MNSVDIDKRRLIQTGDNVRAARKRKGITQEELADQTNLTVATISHLESGANGTRLSNLYRIVVALQVDIRELCAEEIQLLGTEDKDWKELNMYWRNLDAKSRRLVKKTMLTMMKSLLE